jgi:UDP-N-acetylmuramyl tripeptide synthase
MTKIVEKYSDIMIITDDDASGEDRWRIFGDMHKGAEKNLCDQYYMIPNRRDAIALACSMANP